MQDKPKQVIVIRQKFPNPENGGLRKLRTGKYVAQGCHASQLATWDAFKKWLIWKCEAFRPWMWGTFAKVCVYVEGEEELLELAERAKAAGLPFGLVKDSGLTEFGGVRTYTALAIGPARDSALKPITGHLPLF